MLFDSDVVSTVAIRWSIVAVCVDSTAPRSLAYDGCLGSETIRERKKESSSVSDGIRPAVIISIIVTHPRLAKACHNKHSLAPPVSILSALTMAVLASRKSGLQGCNFIPSRMS